MDLGSQPHGDAGAEPDHPMGGLVRRLPKAELHLHIEGSLEPELMFELATKNGVDIPFESPDEIRAAYEFENLQSFLDIYYQGMAVLQTEDDYRRLMVEYLDRAIADGVRRAEIFFDPQAHTERGVDIGVVIEGLAAGQADRADSVSTDLILCFLRHLPGDDAVAALEAATPPLTVSVTRGFETPALLREVVPQSEPTRLVLERALDHGDA